VTDPAVPGAAFYLVCDSRYFLGALGTINSLRLLGHREPINVLDCGLTAGQRSRLEPEVRLIEAPADRPPYLLKTVAPLARPAETAILIDADMIVTRPLDELIASVASGGVVAFRNDTQRFVPEWGELLELGDPRPRPYITSALALLGGEVGGEVLRLLDDRQNRIDFARTLYGRDEPDYPFLYPEQDVLNAILCTRPEGTRIVALEHRLVPNQPFDGLRLAEERTLRCSYADGTEPYALHHYLIKPWLEPIYHGIYSRLLSRLLLAEDVAIRVPEEEVPLRMRRGLRARLERKRVDIPDLVGWKVRGLLPDSYVARRDARRRRRAAAR
jgi:hypothetical protein